MSDLIWRLRFFLNVSPWSLQHFFSPRLIPDTKEGRGYAGPERVLLMHCDRCGMRRIAAQWVEMHPAMFGDGWWHECLTCALSSMTKIIEARLERAQ